MQHRCKNCNKQLAQGCFSGSLNIKCPRCKHINLFKYLSTQNAHERHLESEAHGTINKTLR